MTREATVTSGALVENGSEFFEVVNGQRVEIEPMGAFAGTVASLLVSLLNQFAQPRKLGWARGDVWGGGAVLPGFELPLAEFFDSLPPS